MFNCVCVCVLNYPYSAVAARQASFGQTCSPNRGWIILFEPPPPPATLHLLCSLLLLLLPFPFPPPHPPPSPQELWSLKKKKNKTFFLVGEKRQPWDALPPGWDGFMMRCQLVEGEEERKRMRKNTKHVFLLPTIIWGEEGGKSDCSWMLF